MTDQPFDLSDARRAARELTSARHRAEADYRKQIEKAAESEANYRKKLAAAFLNSEGTVAAREATAKAATADAAKDRDIQAGLSKACMERLKGLEGERALLRLFCEWSMRMEGLPTPQWSGNSQ